MRRVLFAVVASIFAFACADDPAPVGDLFGDGPTHDGAASTERDGHGSVRDASIDSADVAMNGDENEHGSDTGGDGSADAADRMVIVDSADANDARTCRDPSDCSKPAGECWKATCAEGACGIAPVGAGTAVANQVAGDCKRVVCDGVGSTQSISDDTDIEDDANVCTTDGCSNGMRTHVPVPVGTACAAGFCDSVGGCAQCLVGANCGAATACAAPTCVDEKCGVSYSAAGMRLGTQTSGDCKVKVCDGQGGTQEQNDDTDLPNDDNPCTVDGCSNGAPTHTAQTGHTCGSNGVCSSEGKCVGCNSPNDCQGTDDFCKARTCVDGVCAFSFITAGTALPAAQQTAGDCLQKVCGEQGTVQSIAASSDVPVDGNPCTLDRCAGSTPENPGAPPGTACSSGGGTICDGNGACVQCLSPADCGTPAGSPCVVATCANHGCGTANAGAETVCGGGTCSGGIAELVDRCNGAGQCSDGGTRMCAPFICGASACMDSCVNDAGCVGGYSCDTGLASCTNGPKCTDYCNAIQMACTGTNLQYFSAAACLASCAALPRGVSGEGSGNTVGCRTTHAGYAVTAPDGHCLHAGPGGADVCGADCDGFCTIALAACKGAQQVYATKAQCLTECATFPTSPAYNASIMSGNSFACRMYHLTAATVDPINHCPHIPAASPVCH